MALKDDGMDYNERRNLLTAYASPAAWIKMAIAVPSFLVLGVVLLVAGAPVGAAIVLVAAVALAVLGYCSALPYLRRRRELHAPAAPSEESPSSSSP